MTQREMLTEFERQLNPEGYDGPLESMHEFLSEYGWALLDLARRGAEQADE